MYMLNKELPLSISLAEDSVRDAAKFAQAGFEAVECDLPTHYHDPVDLTLFEPFLSKFDAQLCDSNLRIASYHLPFGTYWDISAPDETRRKSAVAANAALLEMLASRTGEIVVIHPSFEPIAEEQREAHIAACQRSLRELAPIAERTGKRIALENLPRTCLGNTSEEMERLTEGGALCRICMDTTHMFHETPQQFLHRCGRWVIQTHLSDYLTGQNECHWVPGTGSLNWREILEALINLGYAGVYNFEVSGYAPLEILGGLTNALKR